MANQPNSMLPTEVPETKETNRLEAFSDGVFAIAITLLVLDIKVPHGEGAGTLLSALAQQWPNYLAFLGSFLTILIMWASHHTIFAFIKRTSHSLLFVNGLLLMGVTLVPFPTALVAEYLGKPDQNIAAMIYCALFTLIALCYNLLWYIASYNLRLMDKRTDPKWVATISHRYRFGPTVYFIAVVVSYFSAIGGMLITIALALYFALPSNTDQ
jgi:uncharacterized membrane protein